MSSLPAQPQAIPGSFRDPANRVYELNDRILRGLNAEAWRHFHELAEQPFYHNWQKQRLLIPSGIVSTDDEAARQILSDGWQAVLEHERIPFISYAYEWSFSMLKDAALLQLSLLEDAVKHGWCFKDATSFNLQWLNGKPIFIDVPSIERREGESPWLGYRQFCMMFLIPLLLKAHLDIDYRPLLRSQLGGIPPQEAAKLFRGLTRFKKGVLPHVLLQATLERSIARKERDAAPARDRKIARQSDRALLGMLDGLKRLVQALKSPIQHTAWSMYDENNSYAEAEAQEKEHFVERAVSQKPRKTVWDLGCNTGRFSRICARHAEQVIAVDGDHDAIEQLYLAEKQADSSRILPLIQNLADPSPSQGWAGTERLAFDQRGKPDLILCLAVIHHMCLSENVPIEQFMAWLRAQNAEVVVEFVHREDDMVKKLLLNKNETFDGYSHENFIAAAETAFTIKDRKELKGGKREIFHLMPR